MICPLPELKCSKCGHRVPTEGSQMEWYVTLKVYKKKLPYLYCPDCKEDCIPNPFTQIKEERDERF